MSALVGTIMPYFKEEIFWAATVIVLLGSKGMSNCPRNERFVGSIILNVILRIGIPLFITEICGVATVVSRTIIRSGCNIPHPRNAGFVGPRIEGTMSRMVCSIFLPPDEVYIDFFPTILE
jgi:uncharacterized membrane protein